VSRQTKTLKNRRTSKGLSPYWIWGGAGVALLVIIGIFVLTQQNAPRLEPWQTFVIDSRDHVRSDQPPGPYASDPPTGGKHFESPLPAGFYYPEEVANLPPYPEGYLVHSMEHGYVIFWYNCDADPDLSCTQLQQSIQQVMDEYGGDKLIAFPWASIQEPLAMTSWGRLQRFQAIDLDAMRYFVESNRYKAPEPNGM
jgi:hypothetical protein